MGVEEGNRLLHFQLLVPPLRLAAHLRTPPPAATTLMEATYPALSMNITHIQTHLLSEAPTALTHTRTQESCLLPQAHLHRLSQRLKHSQPQPPHHPLATTYARPSTHNCPRTAAAPLAILFMKHFLVVMPLALIFCPFCSSCYLYSYAFTLSSSFQSAQYSSEAVSRLPGRFSGPVSVGEWRASSADH